MKPWATFGLVAAGALTLAGVVFMGADKRTRLAPLGPTPQAHGSDWIGRVVAFVSGHEGGYTTTNRNTDGAGLSFGIMQWAQRPGGLVELLRRMHAADEKLFARAFGPDSAPLLDPAVSRSLAPVAGAVLWESPWVERFEWAGAQRTFRAVQDDLARTGPHMTAAISVARELGVDSERALTMFFDTANQQGPGAIEDIAATTRRRLAPQGPTRVPEARLLQVFAQSAADRHRHPGDAPAPTRGTWRRVGDEWHQFVRSIDLYTNVRRRRTRILSDPSISDISTGLLA